MKREHEKILADLSRNLMDRITTAMSDMNDLCKAFKIPDTDSGQATMGILLFTFMDLIYHMVPNITAKDVARIVEGQFTKFLELEKQREKSL